MKYQANWVISCAAVLSLLPVNSSFGQATFLGLGVLPGESSSSPSRVAADGGTVVGWSGPQAFRWTRDAGMVGLGYLPFHITSNANDVSADGSIVVGACSDVFGEAGCAFMWTPAEGMVQIGAPCNPQAFASGVSADGSVVAGEWAEHGATWTAVDGVMPIDWGSAYGISADGSTVVGVYRPKGYYIAYRWTREDGLISLGDLPGGEYSSVAGSASADGAVIVGASSSANTTGQAREAFRWTARTGMAGLGDLPGGTFDSAAADVSADGSIVVGLGATEDGYRAFIWTAQDGMQDLQDVLTRRYGLPLDNWVLFVADAISGDGRQIVGVGLNPATGQQEAWLADLGPCPADFDHSSSVNSQDFFEYLNAFFAAQSSADFNHDSQINSQDFFDYLAAFFAGCP